MDDTDWDFSNVKTDELIKCVKEFLAEVGNSKSLYDRENEVTT